MSLSSTSTVLDSPPASLVAPYDEVTVVSQQSLNNVLRKAFEEMPALHKVGFKAPAGQGDDGDDDFSGFDAIFDAPTIELELSTENRVVTLLLHIKGGTLRYLKVSGRTVTEESVVIPAFIIATDVNLVQQEVPFTAMPEYIQTRFAMSKDFQIVKVLVDLKVASFARLRKYLTTLNDVVPDLTQAALITAYLERYIKLLADNQEKFILTYVAAALSTVVAQDGYPLPSIAPIGDIALQNLPTGNMTGNTKTGEESLLAFLQMTDGGVLPRAQLPTANSKWAEGIDTRVEHPVIIVSKNKFLEKSIISALIDINQRSTWIIDQTSVEATLFPPEVVYELTGHLGWEDVIDADLAWVPLRAEDVPSDTCVKVAGAGAWYHFKNANYRAAHSKIVYEVSQRATTENFIFVPTGIPASGKTQVYIFGKTLVEFNTKLQLSLSSGWAMNQWSTQIVFDSSKPEEPITIIMDDTVRGTTTAQSNDDELMARVVAPVKRQLNQFKFSLRDLGGHLKGALQSDWPFFIPVRGAPYYIDRVFFGGGLDFICETKQRRA